TISNPEYKKIPMAVCGEAVTRHGIILAKNDNAKKLGVITGESIFSAKQKVPEINLVNANFDVNILKNHLGKNGLTLCQFANGDDFAFNPKVSEEKPFKSMGNTITLPSDISDEEDIFAMFFILCKTLCSRLHKHNLVAKCISINFKYFDFKTVIRQSTLNNYSDNIKEIFFCVKMLFQNNYNQFSPIRSVGVHLSNLYDNSIKQLTLFEDENNNDEIDKYKKIIEEKMKKIKIDKSAKTNDFD
ncbi:MAG: hypothetical protein RR549_05375, partial [Oscillospiraceae bacterium]